MKIKSMTLATLMLITQLSFSGTEGGGGGDTVQTTANGRGMLDLAENDDLKFFNFDYSNYSEKINYTYDHEILGCPFMGGCVYGRQFATYNSWRIQQSNIFNQTVARCGGANAWLGTEAEYLYPNLKPLRWALTKSPLENIADEGIIRVTNPETKRQVAIQQGDLVVINENEFNSMDNVNKAALKLHESVLCAVKTLNPNLIKNEGTAAIRYYVRQFVSFALTNDLAEGTPAEAVNLAAMRLYPNPVQKVETPIDTYVEAPDKNNTHLCQVYMFSTKDETPNARVECYSKINSFYYDTYKIELSEKAPVLYHSEGNASWDTTTGRDELHRKTAVTTVKKNIERLKKEWNKYIKR